MQRYERGGVLRDSHYSLASNNMTHIQSDMKHIGRHFNSGENIADELNQSCSEKKMLKMSINTLGRYVA